MKIVLDACVLYPTVMREVLLGVARAGLFEPLWSEQILEEWARAARKIGETGEAQARAEIALLRRDWPEAARPAAPEVAAQLWLPDADDVHVLAVAVQSGAGAVMTVNAKDFPRRILAEQQIERIDPDAWLTACLAREPEAVSTAAAQVLATAQQMSGEDWQMRALMKKARLPRLGKALAA